MAKKTIKAQMKQRRDTKANWAATNPVLLDGELGIVSDDPNLYKVGDGTTAWNALPFRGFDGTLAQELGTSPNAVISQKVVSEKLTELESKNKYVKGAGKRIAELYLTGLNPEKEYEVDSLRFLIYGTYRAKQILIYNKTDNVQVAIAEQSENSVGVYKLITKAEGVGGYVVFNMTPEDTDALNNLDVIASVVSDLSQSPSIKEHLSKIELNAEIGTRAKKPNYAISENPEVNRMIKELYLTGLKSDKFYFTKEVKRLIYNSYIVDLVYIYEADDEQGTNAKRVAGVDDANFYKSVIKINEHNSSGINGYVIKDIKETDTKVESLYLLNKEVISSLDMNPSVKEFLAPKPLSQLSNSQDYGILFGEGTFVFDSNKIIATWQGLIAPEDGYITGIQFRSSNSNPRQNLQFGIGMIDQRGIAVIRNSFELPIITGWLSSHDLSNNPIEIKKGEQLFNIIRESKDGVLFKSYGETDDNTLQMIYGSETGELGVLRSTYGGGIGLTWTISDIKTPFATKEKVENLEDSIAETKSIAEYAQNNIGIFRDREGNTYKAMVVNGNLSLIPMKYKKIVVFCNSIGVNGRLYNQGWGGFRGMASSRYGLDYASHLQTGFRQKTSDAVVTMVNVWEWENDFSHDITKYDNALTSDVDCIIFRAGENVKDTSAFETNLKNLMLHAIERCPSAEVVITSMVWTNTSKDTALLNVAKSLNAVYVNVAANTSMYKERVGHYLEGDLYNQSTGEWDTSQQVMYKIIGTGIAGHTNDVGMLLIANNILQSLNYTPLDKLRNITIHKEAEKTCDIITNTWVVDGVVNVVSNGVVSVKTTSGNTINVTDHEDGVFTFFMPDSDVIVNVA